MLGKTLVVGFTPDNSLELINSFEIQDAVLAVDILVPPPPSLHTPLHTPALDQIPSCDLSSEAFVVFACCSGVTFICPIRQLINVSYVPSNSSSISSSSSSSNAQTTVYRYDSRLIHHADSCTLFCCGGQDEFYYVTSLGQVTVVSDVSRHLKSLAI